MAVSVLFFVVIASAPHWALSLFTNDEDVIAEGVIYLRIICYSYFFFCLTNTLLNGLKAVETVKIGLGISIMTLFVNIALNYCLIYGTLASGHGARRARRSRPSSPASWNPWSWSSITSRWTRSWDTACATSSSWTRGCCATM